MKSVLVVDDDPVVREMLRLRFEEAGYRVLESGDGSQVAAILREDPIDLLVIDIFMPGKGGLETLLELSTQSTRSGGSERTGFKTIVITGHDRVEAEHFQGMLRQFGVRHIFRKPIDYDALLRAASQLVS
jgi:CheY-like chemotaxis protein